MGSCMKSEDEEKFRTLTTSEKISSRMMENTNGTGCRRLSLNEQIFDNVETEQKTYWLGFLLTDGNIPYVAYAWSDHLSDIALFHENKCCEVSVTPTGTLNIPLYSWSF